MESDWEVGASVKYYRNGEVTDYGTITAYEPGEKLAYTWTNTSDIAKNRDEPTHVTFLIKPMGETVKLTLKHENLLPTDIVEEEDTFQGFNNGWPAILSNLKTLLETGKILPPIHV